MPLVVTDLGSLKLLEWAVFSALQNDAPLKIGLFENDYHPTKQSAYADFVQPTWPGYFQQTLARSGWSVPSTVGGKASSTWIQSAVEWTQQGGAATVYGYFVRLSAMFDVLWSERFNAPRTLLTSAKLFIVPNLTGVTEFVE